VGRVEGYGGVAGLWLGGLRRAAGRRVEFLLSGRLGPPPDAWRGQSENWHQVAKPACAMFVTP
jgi:hypothetical protein